MSCAVVRIYDDMIEVACDSCITSGNMIIESSFEKMKTIIRNIAGRKFAIIMASAGSIEIMDSFFTYIESLSEEDIVSLENRTFVKKIVTNFITSLDDPERDYGKNNNEFIFVVNNKAYYIFATLVEEVETYCAIGSGKPYALTALYMGRSAESAVEIASHFDPFVRKPILSNTIERSFVKEEFFENVND